MILVDANLIFYAEDSLSLHHRAALAWWNGCLSGAEPVGLAWQTILCFVRITTHPRATRNPISVDEAIETVNRWLSQPCVRIIQPTERHWEILARFLHKNGSAANLTMDAHLAALAVEYGCELYSTDSDFSKFHGLRWKNPIK